MKRIGLFGGTFDPVHLGHLILAQAAIEELALDQVIFVPAKISPHKTEMPPSASPADRLAMLKLAINEETRFSIDDRELYREGNSYAIDTVRELQTEHPATEFIYLIGEDNLAMLNTWKESTELHQRVMFAVLKRSLGGRLQKKKKSKKFLFSKQFPFFVFCSLTPSVSRCIDISSTEIRERLAKDQSVRYFLPTSVFNYIEKYKPYKN